MTYRSVFTIFLCLLFLGLVTAQTTSTGDPKKIDISDELRQKSVSLLNRLASEADQFYVPENRVGARSMVANLLWGSDEKQARQLFQNAVGELDTLIGQIAFQEELADDDYLTMYNLGLLRTDLLKQIASHDPVMALTALQTLSHKKPDGTDLFEGDDALELELAAEIVTTDPKQAYELAIKSLDKEMSYAIFETLEAIHKKDDELGAKLARDILNRVKDDNKRSPSRGTPRTNAPAANSGAAAEEEGIYIWQIKMFYDKVKTLNRRAVRDKKTPALTDSENKELLQIMAQKYVKQQYLGPYEVSGIMSELDKNFPALAQAIRRKIAGDATSLEDLIRSDEFEAETAEKSLAEINKIIEQKPAAQREALYQKAAETAFNNGDILAAKDLYGKVKTKPEYDYLGQELENKLPLALAESGNLNEVREMLSNVKTAEERIEILSALAKSLLAGGDVKTAKALADEARSMYSGKMRNRRNLTSILQLSQVLVVLEPDQGFSFLENSMSFVNEVIAAGILIDEYNETGSVKSEEVLLSTVESESYRDIPQGVALIRNLAKADFDRTLALSERFSRREARFFARFRIAQALLDVNAEEIEKQFKESFENEYEGH